MNIAVIAACWLADAWNPNNGNTITCVAKATPSPTQIFAPDSMADIIRD